MQHVAPPPANKERRLAFEGESTNEKKIAARSGSCFQSKKSLCAIAQSANDGTDW